MKIMILGHGAIGSVLAKLLHKEDSVKSVISADMCFKEEMQYLRLTRRRLTRELADCGMRVMAHAPLCLLPPFAAMKVLRRPDGAEKLLRFERARRLLPFLGSYHFFYCTARKQSQEIV